MVTLVSVLVVVLLTLVVTRAATAILVSTGMSQESARFQARSALSGAGFTTNGSESVVEHPVRRRVISMLMVFGSAGLVTAVASLALSFATRPAASAFRACSSSRSASGCCSRSRAAIGSAAG